MITSTTLQALSKPVLCLVSAAFLGLTVTSCKSMKAGGSEYPEYATSNDGSYNPYPDQGGYQTYTQPQATQSLPQYQQYTPPPSYTPSPEPEPSYTPSPKPKPKKKTPAKSSSSSRSRYTVRQGDTLYRISVRNNTSVSRLKSANGLSSDLIKPGQVLRIP